MLSSHTGKRRFANSITLSVPACFERHGATKLLLFLLILSKRPVPFSCCKQANSLNVRESQNQTTAS